MPNRLREFREKAGLTRKALAELAGTGPTQILKLETGERGFTDQWAARLAVHLGVEPYEMFMADEGLPQVQWIPLIGEVACGNWREAVESPVGHVPAVGVGKRAFALRPVGDSMNLLISEEGYVLVDPDELDLIDGKIYVVANGDGETTAKRYRANPARLVPCSTNSSHQEVVVGSEAFTVIGRIVQAVTPV